MGRSVLTSFVQPSVHDPVLDLHVAGEVSLQRELAGAVETLEGFAVGVEMHVAHQVVHSVELLPTKLREGQEKKDVIFYSKPDKDIHPRD